MFRRLSSNNPLRAQVAKTSQQTSRPVYEVLFSKLGAGSRDSVSSAARASKEVALLHKYHIHNLGCWRDAPATVRSALAESSEEGKEAAKILDEALELAGSSFTDKHSKILILYGSQTGTAEAMARMAGLFAKSTAGLDPVVLSLNDGAALLQDPHHGNDKYGAVLILCSTYGAGDMPNNATKFLDALATSKDLAARLAKIPHAVFGLGNSSNNDNFNAAAKRLAAKMQEIGSETLCAPIYSCELAEEGHDAMYRAWKGACWSALGRRSIGSGNAANASAAGIVDIYEVAPCIGVAAETTGSKSSRINFQRRADWFAAPVTYNEVKSAPGYEPRFRHMVCELDLKKTQEILGRKLKATDQLVVQPHNPKEYVDRALKLFKLTGSETFDIVPLPGASSNWFDGHKLTARTIFSEVIDLSALPQRSAIASLISAAKNPAEKATLERLSNDLTARNEYSQLIAGGKVFTVIDMLERFPSLELTLSQAMTRLPHIQCRYYSNAHWPATMSSRFEVLYNVPIRHDGAKTHVGLATSTMEEARPGASTLWCSLEPGKTALPPVEAPALYIGLGSGIGLVRAALEERAAAKKSGSNAAASSVGRCVVIYGFREHGKDAVFKEELEQFRKDGVIDDLRLVASYEVKGKFISPFDQIDADLAKFITEKKAYVFYCGLGGSVPQLLEQQCRRRGINVRQMRQQGRYLEEYFTADLDQENLLKQNAAAAAANGNSQATLAEKFAETEMFCFQCEQTKGCRVGGVGNFGLGGCTKVGVCGKKPTTAALQDLTVYYSKVLGFYLHQLRALGAPENAALNRLSLSALFSTLTNVNFDDDRFVEILRQMHGAIQASKAAYEAAVKSSGASAVPFPADQMVVDAAFAGDAAELVAAGRAVGVLTRFIDAGAQNAASVCELLTYGCKGIAAYADHALMNGRENAEVYAFLHKAMSFMLTKERHDLGKAVAMCLEAGKANVTTMSMLYDSHTTLGVPSPHSVAVKPKPGKCILISGHDLIMLRELLPICDREGINVYTHGEMLPAHGYPELRKHKSLAGQFGTAWYRQAVEFAHFPGAILMTTNCLIENPDEVRARLFTAGAVGWPGCKHIGNAIEDIDFAPLIASAKAAPGFSAADTAFTYPDPIGTPAKRPESHLVGFGHEAILGVAPKIIEEITKGNITRFAVIGGCDGSQGPRNYFSDLALSLPKTSIVLTVGCGKFRVLPFAEQMGTIPGNSGIPRVLDLGQCNDSFSAVQVALALAGVLKCNVSDLPLSIALSWLEQKAAAVLLSCIYLGLKPIRIGPSLPAFITPDVLKVLVEQFGILPVGDPVADATSMVNAKGMIESPPPAAAASAEGKGGKK